MSCRILHDPFDSVACLYDSVSGVAFGEVFNGEECYEDAERFLEALSPVDPRKLTLAELKSARRRFAVLREDELRPDLIPIRKDAA